MNFVKKIIFLLQVILTYTIYLLLKGKRLCPKDGVVVGVETASVLKNLASVVGHDSINLSNNRFYSFEYTYKTYSRGLLYSLFYRCYLLALAAHKYSIVTYIGSDSLLLSNNDFREWEFAFLKKNGLKIVCVYLGTDIRSFSSMNKVFEPKNIDTIATYHNFVLNIDLEKREQRLKGISRVTDKYSDLIFNYPVDQMSYLESNAHYFPYIIDDQMFVKSDKWSHISKLVVLHCPSSPIIKGTQIVRAAVKKLQLLGYDFEYVELIGVSHEKVRSELARSHIVLNEFYAFVPGVFGLEALASHAALLTSADKNIEPMLPEGANDAWIVTPYWDVLDNLKAALDMPVEQLKKQADKGYEWAEHHASYRSAKAYLDHKYSQL